MTINQHSRLTRGKLHALVIPKPRPCAIAYTVTDPLDERFLGRMCVPYDRRKAAMEGYTHNIAFMREWGLLAAKINKVSLGIREPKVRVQLIAAASAEMWNRRANEGEGHIAEICRRGAAPGQPEDK